MKTNTTNKSALNIIIWVIAGLILFYVAVNKLFVSLAVNCDKVNLPTAACECLKTKIDKNIPFVDKMTMLISGASSEQLASYLSITDALDCALRDPGFVKSF